MAYFTFKNQRIFYNIKGNGQPILLIHGNSVSSRMFDSILKLYSQNHQVITFDFPGHGKSDGINKFETDFWFYNALVANALLEELSLGKVAVIGTSGGALVGINLALEYPEKVKYLVADSFEGEYPLKSYISSLKDEREQGKKDSDTQAFWQYCHGDDWEKVVDLDTEMLLCFSKLNHSFFHQSIANLKVPTLLTGSKKDEFCDYLEDIYLKMKEKNNMLEIHLFEEGFHPAMLSNAEKFFELVLSKI